MISLAERRVLGRFDTPRPLAQALADWAIRTPLDKVLEPSCGGGVIAKSAVSRFIELGAQDPSKSLWACDIDPRALAETSRALAPLSCSLHLGDFLATSPETFSDIKFNAIIGNPPFVRRHTMDPATRLSARRSLTSETLLSAKASLWAYFPMHAFQMLEKGGRMGWILPETVLHAVYGKQLLSWAKNNFSRSLIVSLRERCFLSEGAKERVVFLLLDNSQGPASREIEMVEFKTAKECIASLPEISASPTFPRLNGHSVPHLVSQAASQAADDMDKCVEISRLQDFAQIRIGVVTGNNKYFLFTSSRRKAEKLRKCHFKRIVSKIAALGLGFDFAGAKTTDSDRSWILSPSLKSTDNRLASYLKLYPTDEILTNRTMQKRANWQSPDLGIPPHAFLQYMGKQGPRLILNSSGYYCTNTIHRVFFTSGVSDNLKKAICLSLHSSYSQLAAEFEGRQYGSGVLKLEPSEGRRLCLAMNPELQKALSKAWPKFNRIAEEHGWKRVVPEIDSLIVKWCPKLCQSLPLEKVKSLLSEIQQRRNSCYLAKGM